MPKGKLKSKAPVNTFEKRVSELDTHAPFRTCFVCGREGRNLQYIPPLKHRCDGCYPGSSNWEDYYERLKPGERTKEQTYIYNAGKGSK